MRRITGSDYTDAKGEFRLIKAKKANLSPQINGKGRYWGFREDSISFATHYLCTCLKDGKVLKRFIIPMDVLSSKTSFRIYENDSRFNEYLIKGDL